jgi:CHAT domain-containing protein
VQHEDFQLSFLTNAAAIYDDYVHFIVAQGKTEAALRWADYSRARTLSEGLGLVPKATSNPPTQSVRINPSPLDLRVIAARAKGTILYYWLGEKQSYLWAITKQKTSLFPLPPAAEINATAERYRKSLTGLGDALESSDEDGRALYRTLVAPARILLSGSPHIFVIPDGGLNKLNFETLIVDTPKLHYWIEDADIVNASSLRVLAASFSAGNANHRKLLLIGNSIPPDKDYPALPEAAAEMNDVAKYFPAAQQRTYSGNEATPGAYLASNPEQFSYIHFVAHGTASRLSPLDSAIVLSRDRTNSDSFKLYAREIVRHPLQAELVTISSCYGAGQRAYSGEGLVGLAWAFLRAGAHYVVAALWEATGASTSELMDDFYRELNQGRTPDAALRHAKLSLIHSGKVFRKPFYWAPFQLYTGRDSLGSTRQ